MDEQNCDEGEYDARQEDLNGQRSGKVGSELDNWVVIIACI